MHVRAAIFQNPVHTGDFAVEIADQTPGTSRVGKRFFLLGGTRMDERAEVLTPTEARQASPRRLNFRVLVVSMLLAIAVAAILYYAVYDSDTAISVPDEPAATEPAAP